MKTLFAACIPRRPASSVERSRLESASSKMPGEPFSRFVGGRRACSRIAALPVLFALTALVGCGGKQRGGAASESSANVQDHRAPLPTYKNLVLVVADALASRHLPSYGYSRDTAPFVTRLAREGIQLQGYSASSWTRSSIATLLTGVYPQRHRAVDRNDALPADVPFLPKLLAERGVQTFAYVTNGNVGKDFGFDRDYTRFVGYLGTGKPRAAWVRQQVAKMLPSLRAPFFLYVHLIDPHDPYVPRRAWDNDPPSPAEYIQPQQILGGKKPPSAANISRLRNEYDGEIREMDRGVENMVADLRERGLLEDTLLIFTADHGEEFYEHNGVAHGRTLYDEVVAVPFVLWNLKPPLRPRSSADRFSQVDFAPTMLEALGLRPDSDSDGVSTMPDITGGRFAGSRDLLFHLDLDRHRLLAIQSGPNKFIMDISRPGGLLFDLHRDPAERVPLPISSPEQIAMGLRLRNANKRLIEKSFHAGTSKVSDETKKQLKALGYLH